MNITSTTYNTPITNDSYTCNIYITPICRSYVTSCLYGDWLDSLSNVKDKNMLMFHLPSEINEASRLFPGYLTDEELQEKQYKGRFWAIERFHNVNSCSYISESFIHYLYILVDNETVVIVNTEGETIISERGPNLPTSLKGRYYYDEC